MNKEYGELLKGDNFTYEGKPYQMTYEPGKGHISVDKDNRKHDFPNDTIVEVQL